MLTALMAARAAARYNDQLRCTQEQTRSEDETYFCRRPRQCIADPSEGDHIACIDPRRHKHHSKVARPGLRRGGGDDEGNDGEVQGSRDMKIALACPVGMPSIEESGHDSESVRWHGE